MNSYLRTHFRQWMMGLSSLAALQVAAQSTPPAVTAPSSLSLEAAQPASPAAFPTDAVIRATLDKRIIDKKGKGFAIALLSPDGTVRFVNAGDSGVKDRPAIDADTIFEIGSITKTFTGTLLAQMVAKGEVSLDGKVRQYAPKNLKFREKGAGDITLLQLATHTSGLPRLPMGWAMAASFAKDIDNPYKNFSLDNMWNFIADEKTDTTKTYPSAYSNLGMGLLGDLLATRAGVPYAQLVKRDILDLLGMTDSGMTTAPNAAPRLAIGHTEGLAATSYWEFGSMSGAGGLRSSARDMARYIQAQKTGALAGSEATQTKRAVVNETMDIGLAWHILKRNDDEIIWHNGGTGGFRSFAGFSKKSGLGIVVLSNTANSVDDIGVHLLNAKFKLQ